MKRECLLGYYEGFYLEDKRTEAEVLCTQNWKMGILKYFSLQCDGIVEKCSMSSLRNGIAYIFREAADK